MAGRGESSHRRMVGRNRIVFFLRGSRSFVESEIRRATENQHIVRNRFTAPTADDGRYIAFGFVIVADKQYDFSGDPEWNDNAKEYTKWNMWDAKKPKPQRVGNGGVKTFVREGNPATLAKRGAISAAEKRRLRQDRLRRLQQIALKAQR